MIKWLTATDLVLYKPLISEKNHKKTKQAQSSDGKFLLLSCTFFNEIVSMLNFWLIMNLVRLEKYKTILWPENTTSNISDDSVSSGSDTELETTAPKRPASKTPAKKRECTTSDRAACCICVRLGYVRYPGIHSSNDHIFKFTSMYYNSINDYSYIFYTKPK